MPLDVLHYGGRLLNPQVAVECDLTTVDIGPGKHADGVATEIDHVLMVVGGVAPDPDVRAEPVAVSRLNPGNARQVNNVFGSWNQPRSTVPHLPTSRCILDQKVYRLGPSVPQFEVSNRLTV